MPKWSDLRVQSFGLLPMPASLLVVPGVDMWESKLEALLRLELNSTPREWEFFRLVSEGEVGKAHEAISRIEEGDVRIYNSAIMSGDPVEVERAIEEVRDDTLRVILVNVLNLSNGFDVEFPGETRRDVLALLNYMQATLSISRGDLKKSTDYLDEAMKSIKGLSPVFEAHILFKKAGVIRDLKGESYHLISLYDEILNLLGNTGAGWLKSEVHFQMGNMFSTFGNLNEAIKHYNMALEYKNKDREPYTWALIQNNKGLAYLSIPVQDVEDHIRLAYGVQCLKRALDVFTPQTYPDEWASTTLNYANALQYLPTADPVKNLLRAVELYREVLDYRKTKNDREGYARVLANMGNALAHLGKLDEAKTNLVEARSIFSSLGMHEEVEAINEVLQEIKEVEAGDGHSH